MVRTQIQLPQQQLRRLRRVARERGISLSEAVRRCVALALEQEAAAPTREERIRAALAACGRYRDPRGATHIAQDHDRHLAEAFRR